MGLSTPYTFIYRHIPYIDLLQLLFFFGVAIRDIVKVRLIFWEYSSVDMR